MTPLWSLLFLALGGLIWLWRAERARLAQQLAEQEETIRRLEFILNATTDGIWAWDLLTGADYHSPRYRELLGYADDELPHTLPGFEAIVHPEDLPRIQAAQQAHLEQRQPYQVELRLRTRQGDYRWFVSRGQAQWDAEGRPLKMVGTITDITGRKQAEAALQANEEHLQLITDTAPVILLEFDLDLRYRFVNRRAADMIGLSRSVMLGRPVREVIGERSFIEALPYMRQALAGQAVDFEVELSDTPQGCRIMDVHYVPRHDASGAVIGLVAAVTDITQRKGYEKELRLLRTLVDRNQDNVFITRANGAFHYVNDAACRSLGYSREELLGGMRVPDIDPTFDQTAWDQHWLELKSAGMLKVETLNRRRDGQVFPVEVHVTFIEHEGQPFNCAIVRDISERKQREGELEAARAAASAASQAKSQFLAHMSHEIRTPMNAIMGFTQILERDPLTPDQGELLRKIEEASQGLLQIINDILDFSKIEAGQMSIESHPFALEGVLGQIHSLATVSARAKSLDFHIQADNTLPGWYRGDAVRLRQVLLNLSSNAIKFTERGRVELRVSPVAVTATTARLRFEVSDTGIGIAPATLGSLFRPFTQADATTTRRFGGTGLGLSISKRLVELMGGDIGATSTPGVGSVFWFELPLVRDADPGAAVIEDTAAPDSAKPSGPRLSGLRVLAVDDNRINLLVLERALELEDAHVSLAADGRQALEILRTHPAGFDIVLMDVQMPVMDGLTATRAIRADPALARLPVVALTAGVLAEERAAAQAAGVNDFLAKPLNLEALVGMLQALRPQASMDSGAKV
ncbi:MAG: PAS domain S-box protein [Methylococcus sp.]